MGTNRWIGGTALVVLGILGTVGAWAWDGDDTRFRQQWGGQAALVWVERRGATTTQLVLTRDAFDTAWLRRPALVPPPNNDEVTKLVRAAEWRQPGGGRQISAVMPVDVFGQTATLVLFFGQTPDAVVVLPNGEMAQPVFYAKGTP